MREVPVEVEKVITKTTNVPIVQEHVKVVEVVKEVPIYLETKVVEVRVEVPVIEERIREVIREVPVPVVETVVKEVEVPIVEERIKTVVKEVEVRARGFEATIAVPL